MKMAKYVLLRNVANFKKGQAIDIDGEVPLGLQAHVELVSEGEVAAETVDVEALTKEAQKEARSLVADLYEKVMGSKAGNSGIEKMCNEIGTAFEAKGKDEEPAE